MRRRFYGGTAADDNIAAGDYFTCVLQESMLEMRIVKAANANWYNAKKKSNTQNMKSNGKKEVDDGGEFGICGRWVDERGTS